MQITRSPIGTARGPADWFTGDIYLMQGHPGDRVLFEAHEEHWDGAPRRTG